MPLKLGGSTEQVPGSQGYIENPNDGVFEEVTARQTKPRVGLVEE